MEYLDKFQLETDIVVQAHVGESDDEDGAKLRHPRMSQWQLSGCCMCVGLSCAPCKLTACTRADVCVGFVCSRSAVTWLMHVGSSICWPYPLPWVGLSGVP